MAEQLNTVTDPIVDHAGDHESPIDPDGAVVELLGSVSLAEVVPEDDELAHAVERFESRGFAKEAPKFQDMLTDQGRDNRFRYIANCKKGSIRADIEAGDTVVETTEHDGMNGLNSFLNHVRETQPLDAKGKPLAPVAEDIQENLTFIGQKEYNEATKGIAAAWKAYLDADPGRQLCVLAGVSSTTKGEESRRKSDNYLLEKVLEHFGDEELEAYGDRLIGNPERLTAEPESARIVMLDDWTISGQQLQYAVLRTLKGDLRRYKRSLEINLIAASADRIENGLEGPDGRYAPSLAPVKAYYRAHSSDVLSASGSRITGTHSSVDHDYDDDIRPMVQALADQGEDVTMPPATNIVREYRNTTSSVSVGEDGRFYRLAA
jgi:hypothetical protein